jgi:hypothetical protein
MRVTRVLRDANNWIYWLTGTFQNLLVVTDIILFFVKRDVTKISLVIFIGLNLMLGLIISIDINNSSKRELEVNITKKLAQFDY